MTIPPEVARKLDETLRRMFEAASPEDPCRVIVTLASASEAVPPPQLRGLNRMQSREVLADHRRRIVADVVEPVRKRLEENHLITKGGSVSPVLVVEGTAAHILDALAMPQITRAAADHPIAISVA